VAAEKAVRADRATEAQITGFVHQEKRTTLGEVLILGRGRRYSSPRITISGERMKGRPVDVRGEVPS
jgi:hypothetical protein